MVFCKDCKFCLPHTTKHVAFLSVRVRRDFESARCVRPEVQSAESLSRLASFTDFLVTGKGGPFCAIARRHDEVCGTNARYFEAANG